MNNLDRTANLAPAVTVLAFDCVVLLVVAVSLT